MRPRADLSFTARLLLAAACLLISAQALVAQTTAARPDRGTMPNGSYAVSDFENISLQNGNVNLSIPLAALPAIAGGKLSWVLKAQYNSKLWNVTRTEVEADTPTGSSWQSYVVDNPQVSDLAGWRIGGQYTMSLRNAHEDFDYLIPPAGSMPVPEYQLRLNYNWYKLVISMPDGSEHELRPLDYTPYTAGDSFLLGYFKENPYQNGAMRYYSFDGSYLYATMTSLQEWTLYTPDGTKVIQTTDGIQRIQDTNGNKIKVFSDANGTHYRDEQTGREIRYSYDPAANNNKGQGVVSYMTVGGIAEQIYLNFDVTQVQGQAYRVKDWLPGHTTGCNRYNQLSQEIQVIREIILPQTEQGWPARKFIFHYNSDTTETATTSLINWTCSEAPHSYTRTASKGWGELSQVEMPSGAVIDYSYRLDATHVPLLTDNLAEQSITQKKLTHDNRNTFDTWTYDISPSAGTVTGPDGSTVTETKYEHSPGMGSGFGKSGLVYRTQQPFSRVERHWTHLAFSGASFISPNGNVDFNSVVDFEYTTLLDTSNNALKMSAKAFQYDYNGNLLQTTEYDWFDPALVSRDAQGVPTGVPSSAAVLRVTNNSYYNGAADAASANVYAKRSMSTAAPLILNAVKESVTGASQARFSYDGQAYGTAPTAGNLTTQSKWDNVTNSWISSSMTYDAYGNVATTTDPKGNVTQLFYEDATHALPTRVVVDPQNGTGQQTSQTSYDFSTGAVLSQTDQNNQVSTVDYNNPLLGAVDPFGRPGATYSPAVMVNGMSRRRKTSTLYEDHLRRVTVSSDLNAEGDGLLLSRTTQDDLGRPVLVEQSENGSTYTISSQTVYEQLGKITYQSNPSRGSADVTNGWTRSTKDVLGRVTEVASFSGTTRPAANIACDAASNCTGRVASGYAANQTTVMDQAGKQRRSIVNALGQLTRVDEPDVNNNLGSVDTPAQPTSYSYDTLGNLTQVIQGTQTRSFTYSSLSRLTSASNPESGIISYSYDANGNLTQKADARSVTTTYAYDGLNRATSRTYSDGTPAVTYTYDAAGVTNSKGRLTSVSSTVSVSSYGGYDALGRITASTQSTDGQSYQMNYGYNLAGALTSETYPSGRVVSSIYDNAGRLGSVMGQKTGEAAKTYASSFNYTAHGAVKELKLGNNLWEHTSFNTRLQPTEIALGSSITDSNKLQLSYTYGTTANNGNVLSQTITISGGPTLSQTYSYDSLNRLDTATESNASVQTWKQRFSYDRFGNRTFNQAETSQNVLGANPTISTANNRINATGYSYDLAGNLLSDPNHSYSYDAENRMISNDGGANQYSGVAASYSYDGDGRRVKKAVGITSTVFVYDAGGQLVAEYGNQTGGSGTSYLTADNLGTPRIITDASGVVKARHDYLPFGEEINAQAVASGRDAIQGYSLGTVRQKFTQYERDNETGLDYAKARYYSTTQGRFTSADPLVSNINPASPQSWNRYAYCINNPLIYVDPSGLIWGRIGDGDVIWYKDKTAMKAAGAKEWTQMEYGIGNDQYVRLSESGPNTSGTTQEERQGWSIYVQASVGVCDAECQGRVHTQDVIENDRPFQMDSAIDATWFGFSFPFGRLSGPAIVTKSTAARFLAREGAEVLDTSAINIPGPLNSAYGKVDYLLGRVPGNVSSQGKGGFFVGVLGFSDETLAGALRSHLRDNFSTAVIDGAKIRATGQMVGPNGRTANVLSVWEITNDTRGVSFVTAQPGPK